MCVHSGRDCRRRTQKSQLARKSIRTHPVYLLLHVSMSVLTIWLQIAQCCENNLRTGTLRKETCHSLNTPLTRNRLSRAASCGGRCSVYLKLLLARRLSCSTALSFEPFLKAIAANRKLFNNCPSLTSRNAMRFTQPHAPTGGVACSSIAAMRQGDMKDLRGVHERHDNITQHGTHRNCQVPSCKTRHLPFLR